MNLERNSSAHTLITAFHLVLFRSYKRNLKKYSKVLAQFLTICVILASHTSLFLDKLRHCDNCLRKKNCYAHLTNLFCFDFV